MSAPTAKALTSGEARVATLVHAGLTNPEIARALSLSESTVKNHLNSIYHKGGETGPVNREELKAACAAGVLGMGKDQQKFYAPHTSNTSASHTFSTSDFRYATTYRS